MSVERKPRLLDQVRTEIWLRHYSPRTAEAYAGWVRWFILFYGKRHPSNTSERGPDGSMPADSRPLQSRGRAAAADRHTLRWPPGCRRVCRLRALLEPTASGGSRAGAIV